MYKKEKKEKEIPRRQMLVNLTTTIRHLETLMKLLTKHPANDFLQKEIHRLKTIRKNTVRNDKSN